MSLSGLNGSEDYLLAAIMDAKNVLENSSNLAESVEKTCQAINIALNSGGKIIAFGNGGSSSEASHLVSEFQWRVYKDKRAMPAISINSDPAVITAIANDSQYDDVFSRQIEALCNKEDVVIALSTSGNSKNVLKAVETANKIGATTIGMTGTKGTLKDSVKVPFCVQSEDTGRIQEIHLLLIHVISSVLEDESILRK